MKQEPSRLEVESKVDSLPVIAGFVSETLDRLGVDEAAAFKVQLAIEEACANVIKHAYAGGGGPLTLTIGSQDDELVVTVTDRGIPFDPRTVPPPDLDACVEDRKIGGLGIFFMQKLMDEVSYSFEAGQGNRLTMRKRLAPRPGPDRRPT